MRTSRSLLILFAIVALTPLAVTCCSGFQKKHTVHNSEMRSVSAGVPGMPPVHHSLHIGLIDGVHGAVLARTAATGGNTPDEVQRDGVALDDMHNYALHHFGIVQWEPVRYGSAEVWPGWQYHWADYDDHHEVVHVFHVMPTHNDSLRYTAHWDSRQARYHDWELAH